jgi:hypothetical protein
MVHPVWNKHISNDSLYLIDKPLAVLFIYRESLVSHLGMEIGSPD